MDQKRTPAEWAAMLIAISAGCAAACIVALVLGHWRFWPLNFIGTLVLFAVIGGGIVLLSLAQHRNHRGQEVSSIPQNDSTAPFVSAEPSRQADDTADLTEEAAEAQRLAEGKKSTTLQTEWMPNKPRFKEREIIADEEGNQYLVIRALKESRVRHDDNSRHIRKKRLYRIIEIQSKLAESHLVDPDLVLKSGYKPTSEDTDILACTRYSWWRYGYAKIAAVLAGLLYTFEFLRITNTLIQAILICTVWTGIAVFMIWLRLKWAYVYFILTNREIRNKYRPPKVFVFLIGDDQVSPLSKLDTFTLKESRMSNFLCALGVPAHYGTLESDTDAQETDEWLHKMKYIPHADDVAELLQQQIAKNSPEAQQKQTNSILTDILHRLE